MGVLKSTSCGSCGAKWQVLESVGNNMLGSPLVKCRVCKSLNKTSLKLYRDMNLFKKIIFWTDTIFTHSILGFAALFFGIGVGFFAEVSYMQKFIALIITIPLFIFLTKNLFYLPKAIKYFEETYDKNGGYLWSNEMYK